jgi:hypothetical protein
VSHGRDFFDPDISQISCFGPRCQQDFPLGICGSWREGDDVPFSREWSYRNPRDYL